MLSLEREATVQMFLKLATLSMHTAFEGCGKRGRSVHLPLCTIM